MTFSSRSDHNKPIFMMVNELKAILAHFIIDSPSLHVQYNFVKSNHPKRSNMGKNKTNGRRAKKRLLSD